MAMTRPGKGPEPIDAPGLAEIKPENGPAIRDGLNQLRSYLRQSDAARGKATPRGRTNRASWITGSEPERESVWLITYLPWPNRAAPSHVRVFAYEVHRAGLLKKNPNNDRLPPTKDLVKSRRELDMIELPKRMAFPTPDRPDMFGLAVESLVRDRFADTYKRPAEKRQDVRRKGPDVLWRELEELFRELADETGDIYWREVADELSSGV